MSASEMLKSLFRFDSEPVQARLTAYCQRQEHLMNALLFIEQHAAEVIALEDDFMTLRIGRAWYEFWRPIAPSGFNQTALTVTLKIEEHFRGSQQLFLDVLIQPRFATNQAEFQKAARRVIWSLKSHFHAI